MVWAAGRQVALEDWPGGLAGLGVERGLGWVEAGRIGCLTLRLETHGERGGQCVSHRQGWSWGEHTAHPQTNRAPGALGCLVGGLKGQAGAPLEAPPACRNLATVCQFPVRAGQPWPEGHTHANVALLWQGQPPPSGGPGPPHGGCWVMGVNYGGLGGHDRPAAGRWVSGGGPCMAVPRPEVPGVRTAGSRSCV